MIFMFKIVFIFPYFLKENFGRYRLCFEDIIPLFSSIQYEVSGQIARYLWFYYSISLTALRCFYCSLVFCSSIMVKINVVDFFCIYTFRHSLLFLHLNIYVFHQFIKTLFLQMFSLPHFLSSLCNFN